LPKRSVDSGAFLFSLIYLAFSRLNPGVGSRAIEARFKPIMTSPADWSPGRMEATSKALNDAQRWDVLVIELDRVWQDNNVTLVRLPPCTTLLHTLSIFSVHVRRFGLALPFFRILTRNIMFSVSPALYRMFCETRNRGAMPIMAP
jgi:hypothetical protein